MRRVCGLAVLNSLKVYQRCCQVREGSWDCKPVVVSVVKACQEEICEAYWTSPSWSMLQPRFGAWKLCHGGDRSAVVVNLNEQAGHVGS